MGLEFSNNLEELERIEKIKNKVFKFIVYKKRTEREVRDKFKSEIDEDLLEDIIEYMKEQKYLDDEDYIDRFVKETMNLKNSSIKELTYKLAGKGVPSNIIDDYICKNYETMIEYEVRSAKNIYLKKKDKLEEDEIRTYLFKKGFSGDSISQGIEEGKEE
jgi:regulatory protein